MEPPGNPARFTVRYAAFDVKWPPFAFLHPAPRGRTGRTYHFTVTLKELSPMVYAFVVEQLGRAQRDREPMVQPVIEEWRQASGSRRQRPASREFTAFVVERAMDGAWRVWGVEPPYSGGDVDSFYRRYVHGHRHALRDYGKALREPRPWPPFHRGHWLNYFFGARGEAAREFNLLTTKQEPWRVITIFEEDDPRESR
jgi:hypothetical protein